MAVIGKNILENLTTGMYSDSKVIFREYIQNACDQIDIAINNGLLKKNEGEIGITQNHSDRSVCILDNATGVKQKDFIQNLGDIANSNKTKDTSKGFRGIGRLCGLAYCETLIFRTSYKGEKTASIMKCDAKLMRSLLNDNKKYTIDEIWDRIVEFSTDKETADTHYFSVELLNINEENTDLLDDKLVSSYLSFVAPVPYSNKFILSSKIYKFAKENNYVIDEYKIRLNGAEIFKNYSTYLKDKNEKKYDEITDIKFKEFNDKDGRLIAWSWVGLSAFLKAIPLSTNPMTGIRLRTGNIQIGNENNLKKFFKESRGNSYFVGEIFTVDKNLIPNSQRDYFNENTTRKNFEQSITEYFHTDLHNLYYKANKIKNAYAHQEELLNLKDTYNKKNKESSFINEQEKISLENEIQEKIKQVKSDKKILEKFDKAPTTDSISVVNRNIKKKYKSLNLDNRINDDMQEEKETSKKNKNTFLTSKFSKLNNRERKVVGKILSIISDNVDGATAKLLINKITEEFQN